MIGRLKRRAKRNIANAKKRSVRHWRYHVLDLRHLRKTRRGKRKGK